MTKKAPFTDEEIASLNEYQESGWGHPYTCGNGDQEILVATTDGWICKKCAYTQKWCHKWTADWEWKTMMLNDPVFNLCNYKGGKDNHVVGGYSNAIAGKFDY